MKTVSFFYYILVGTGVLLLACALYDWTFANQGLTVVVAGQTQKKSDSEPSDFVYNAKIQNNYSTPIRLCGGQMNWCGQSGCYKVETTLPIVLEPKQKTTITILISPREDKISETELILYADGEGLAGLTPVNIKLPAMSLNSP